MFQFSLSTESRASMMPTWALQHRNQHIPLLRNDRTHGTSNNTYWQYHTVLDLTYSTWFNQYLTFKYLGAHKTMIRKWLEKKSGNILPNWRFLIGFTVYMFTTLWIGGDPPIHHSGLVAGDVEDVFWGSKCLVPGHHLGRFQLQSISSCLHQLISSASINCICRSTFHTMEAHLTRPRRGLIEFHCGHRFRWIRLVHIDKLAIGWASKCVEYNSHVLQTKWKVHEGPWRSSRGMWYFFEKGSWDGMVTFDHLYNGIIYQ